MAAYDYGGGCACGLQRYCDCGHSTPESRKAYQEDQERKAFMADNLAMIKTIADLRKEANEMIETAKNMLSAADVLEKRLKKTN